MRRLHIIGRKNHGKTELMVALIQEFVRRGLRVATIKHSSHRHELDTPGKDSHRHRLAGAAVVGILSDHMTAVFIPRDPSAPTADRYAGLAPLYSDCDLVLVEGDSGTASAKIEVWRAGFGDRPMAETRGDVLAVVTDDPVDLACPVLSRTAIPTLADWILAQFRRDA